MFAVIGLVAFLLLYEQYEVNRKNSIANKHCESLQMKLISISVVNGEMGILCSNGVESKWVKIK